MFCWLARAHSLVIMFYEEKTILEKLFPPTPQERIQRFLSFNRLSTKGRAIGSGALTNGHLYAPPDYSSDYPFPYHFKTDPAIFSAAEPLSSEDAVARLSSILPLRSTRKSQRESSASSYSSTSGLTSRSTATVMTGSSLFSTPLVLTDRSSTVSTSSSATHTMVASARRVKLHNSSQAAAAASSAAASSADSLSVEAPISEEIPGGTLQEGSLPSLTSFGKTTTTESTTTASSGSVSPDSRRSSHPLAEEGGLSGSRSGGDGGKAAGA